jgi:hypothetical protein
VDYIENIQTEDKTATIYTDSQMTLDSLKINTNHTFLIEEIGKNLAEMGTTNWTIQFCWVKVHVGIQGNELTDTLAKDAATNADLIESYMKVPKSVVMSELSEISVETWQREWDLTTKGAITKEYFSVVADRLNMNINITPNLTTIVTGHGNISSYLHRFKIIDTPTCACGSSDQNIDHMLYEYALIKQERDSLISTVVKTDVWPIGKKHLIRKYYQPFVKFINKISFDKHTNDINTFK